MLVEKDVQQMLVQLAGRGLAKIPFDGSDITIKMIDESSKLSLTTLVYDGENYIPNSVRNCLSHKLPSFTPILTFLTVDEHRFQVKLNYLGRAESLDREDLKVLLENFGEMAEKWRLYLDEHGKNDLIHVRVK